eukprot:CAMPEP_0202870286 /NCGR_PEP_ID=MMETSP1391-20130828/15236_1 /ASSEMBLY_ACC=CAM_ASM_000867 /TAXON_ID=1034604 /ORGANISM="Chlamydomonas leiostraca, Strain SAG 11-49" /LENGTH=98 /DNA_ID=CAMNT_0049550815 /DNA_START=254 /DNA_END=546 /DNA_ORIENTATION=+
MAALIAPPSLPAHASRPYTTTAHSQCHTHTTCQPRPTTAHHKLAPSQSMSHDHGRQAQGCCLTPAHFRLRLAAGAALPRPPLAAAAAALPAGFLAGGG